MSSAQEPLVRFSNFSAWYRSDLPPVLRDLNLEIFRHELVLVLGATGSGKSALGLCLNGVIPHMQGRTEGSLLVDGVEVGDSRVSHLSTRVGVIFQDIESQICNLYVQDEVAFGVENLALSVDEVRRHVDRTLEFLHLTHLRDRSVFELSGGQKQKVAIASVLAMDPELVFLDEPTANLDPRSSREVFELISEMAREKTIVVVEKKVEELATLATRVVVLHDGTVALAGPPETIFGEHGLRMMEEMGIWIPQAAEIALRLRREKSVLVPGISLRAAEAVEPLGALKFSFPAQRPSTNGGHGPISAAPAADPQDGEVLIQVENLEHAYPDGNLAVKGVSLEVRRGEVLAIVGPNGSGKTTLVKHFVGLLRPTNGRLLVGGKDTRSASTAELVREIGFVFQFPEHQFVKDSVVDEVGFSLRVRGVPDSEVATRLPAMMELFGLKDLDNRHPFSLSGGEKRRLSVATMLIARPRVLILDEPTYAQDRTNTIRLMASIFAATQQAQEQYAPTLILVTHDMKLVAEYATRVVALRLGEKAYDGSVAGLFEDEALVESVNLEEPAIFGICRRLRANGLPVPDHITSVSDFVSSVVPAQSS